MRHAKRRKWDVVWLGLGAASIGAAGTIGALSGDTERVGNYWLHAELGDDGTAAVTEVIDYDFGPRQRRGIFREIPDVDVEADIEVSSPTAPDQFTQTPWLNGVFLRIGDPDVTNSNRHRYRIDYPIDTLVTEGRFFAWDAVGVEWEVPINNAEIHVTSDRVLTNPRCSKGQRGDRGGCEVDVVELGHLVVSVSGLSAGHGVTIDADVGELLASAPAGPPAPSGPADDPGSGWLTPGLAGLGGALVAGAGTSRVVRRLGREQVWEGGAADAAFGPREGELVGVELMDQDDLAQMATIEFESPRGLSAAAGGIIHSEAVKSEHQIAWLIEAAIRDEVVLEEQGSKEMVLRRGKALPHPAVSERLNDLFGGSDSVELGSYDERFAKAWGRLNDDLEEWSEASGLWDPAGDNRKNRFKGFGFVALLLGGGLAVLGGVFANRGGPQWLPIALVGGLAAGAGFAAMLRAWELSIRTAKGSGQWLQVESFRRFIAASEARHAEAAAERGLLRHYTAWAVALGELNHWKNAVESASMIPNSRVHTSVGDLAFVSMAPTISRATASTFTAPSSSGSGGGGGGVGGGGGGGGGGSW